MLFRSEPPFDDSRLPEMLFRMRARNYPETLTAEEQQRWQVFRKERLDLEAYLAELGELRSAPERTDNERAILDELESYARKLVAG